MPYTHRKEGNKNCVYKKDGGAKVGCTKGDVKKYLAALYANANESIEQPQSFITKIKTYRFPYKEFNKKMLNDYIPMWKEEYGDLAKINEMVARHVLYQISEDIFGGVNEIEFFNETKNPTNHFQMGTYLGEFNLSTNPFIYVDNKHKVISKNTKIVVLNSDYDDIAILKENELKGGKADKLTIKDIANKFNTSVDKIKAQIEKGIKVEMEHTSDKEKATEIATDHVSEFPDYYDRLDKMEGKAKKDWEAINENNKTLIKKLFRENINNPKKKRTLHESFVNGKTIINVDIQPEYQKWITFNLTQWVKFINESSKSNRIVFLYNGEDTLGMVSLSDYQMWLIDLGIDESIIDSAIFYDKGYAFFRYCMDNSIDENDVAQLVRFMISHNINDSRDIDEEMWNQFMEATNNSLEDIRGLLENADDMISIPDLMDFLGKFSNIVLTGGGINECLKEVEIALLAMDKPFNILNQFTY